MALKSNIFMFHFHFNFLSVKEGIVEKVIIELLSLNIYADSSIEISMNFKVSYSSLTYLAHCLAATKSEP